MNKKYETEQEEFWAGKFGSDYIARNELTPQRLASRIGLWSSILKHCSYPISSLLEFGANIGINLRALFSRVATIPGFCWNVLAMHKLYGNMR